jgi:O-antigen/teichoic acid export membrane protein
MRKAASGQMLLGVASMLEALVPLLRNIVLANLLLPADFGIALSFALVLGLLEVLSDCGIPIFVMRRSMNSGLANVLPTLHTLALVRSLVLGASLLLIAPNLAILLQAENASFGFSMLGLIVVARGFENLGTKALLRSGRYAPEATVMAISQLFLLAATVVAAIATRSFYCMIWGLFAHAVAVVGLSHMLSRRNWRLGWRPSVARDILSFGWPLLLNGAAVAASTSDRILVGHVLGPSTLAQYNVAVGSAMLPKTVLARFLTTAFVPRFARVQSHKLRWRELADCWAFLLSAIALGIGLGLAFFGGPVLGAMFGIQYQPSSAFMAALGFGVCVRILLLLPVPLSMARGETGMVANTSLASALAVLISAPVLLTTQSPTLFLLIQAMAEYFALGWVVWRLWSRQTFTTSLLATVALAPPALLAAIALMTVSGRSGADLDPMGAMAVAAFILYVTSYVVIRQFYRIEIKVAVG